MIFLELGIPLVFSEHNLPQDACCVLVACYFWMSYRSFTQKYQDLAAALFEKQQQLKNNGRETSLNMQNVTPNDGRTIPKALFDKACEELMPIRKRVDTLFLEATLSVLLVFLGLSVAKILTLPPATKALLIFVVGLIPKIVTIFLVKNRRRNFEAERFDEKVLEIVKTFLNAAPYIEIRDRKSVSPADFCNKDHLELTIFVNICFTAFVFFGTLDSRLTKKMVF